MKPTILVSTWNDGLFALNGDARTQELASQSVRGLALDGRGGAVAIVGRHSLRQRKSTGEWATLATSELELSCCMSVRDTIYVGTDDARLLRLNSGGREFDPVDGFDRVPGRDAWFAGSAIVNGQRLGPPLGIRSVAANSNGSVLFANVHVGGIPRSTDGGSTWQPTIDINCDVHEVRAHDADPDLVVAASAIGLCISRDAGTTWTVETVGLHDPHCYAVNFSGADIVFSAAADPFAPQGKLYRRPIKRDGSITAVGGPGMREWTDGAPDTHCIAANGSWVAVVDRGGNLYRSEDFGHTWSRWDAEWRLASGVLIL